MSSPLIDFGKQLPKPVFSKILTYLEDNEICQAKLVSKRWNATTNYDPLWKQLSMQFLKIERGLEESEMKIILEEKNKHSDWFNFYKHLKTSRFLICVAGGDKETVQNFMQELNKQLPYPADLYFDKEKENFTLNELKKYNAILFFSLNSFYSSDGEKGNVLYEYVRHGGGCVMMCYLTCGCPLLGKWKDNCMTPILPQQSDRKPSLYLDFSQSEKNHPTLFGVKSFKGNGGESVFGEKKKIFFIYFFFSFLFFFI